jgi:5'-methylthioadenosine phosphorylase/5'-methylthioinosine phosphorylase
MAAESIIGVIGGTALSKMKPLSNAAAYTIDTPYGKPSSELVQGEINKLKFVFLARHGEQHRIPPHLINYQANIWALREAGVSEIVAISTVGGITEKMSPGSLVIPDQIIDYTSGREHTFFDTSFSIDRHIDFTHPYDLQHRQSLMAGAAICNLKVIDGGTMGVTQGPRLETAAEIQRMKRDGCDMVGMTAMPEAALAKELGIPYVSLAVVVNWAAGVSDELISIDEINRVLADMANSVNEILLAYG